MAVEILEKTNDGNGLDPTDLSLLQSAVNSNMTEAGEVAFYELHSRVNSGNYVKPWLCGVEHLTQDYEGFVYWKGEHVEHYSHSDFDDMKRDAEELGRRCLHLEALGVEVDVATAVWTWDKYEGMEVP